ncbi:MAG: HAMP domain-containing sensor histidine kinase [Bacteroidetes bacterium]|nr:HAMP domain-containing sensor histidine kinase [Bacteroidota bacterium]
MGGTLSQEWVVHYRQEYTAMAYNYFFLSDYDSAGKYLDLVMKDTKADTLIKTVAKSCRGWIDQRIGQDYNALNNFESCSQFFSNNENKKNYKNDQLFIDSYMINELGAITQKYYYLGNYADINNDLDKIQKKMNAFPHVANELKFHLHYLFVHNDFNNGKIKPDFNTIISHLQFCLAYAGNSSVYQKGLLFEVLGLYMSYKKIYNPSSDTTLIKITDNCNKSDPSSLCSFIDNILKNKEMNDDDKEVFFKKHALEKFSRQGDPYQIASSYFFLGEYFKKNIEKKGVKKEILDSLRICAEKTLKFFQIRYPKYFDTIRSKRLSLNDASILCSYLVSTSWYLKALNLQRDFFIYQSNSVDHSGRLDSIVFYNSRIKTIEEYYNINSRTGFFNALREAENQTIVAENAQVRNNYVIAIIISFSLLILFLGAFLFYRKRRSEQRKLLEERLESELRANATVEKNRKELENWNAILNKLLNIREGIVNEQEVTIKDSLIEFNSMMCDYFKAEYSAIGLVEKENGSEHVKDLAYRFIPEIPSGLKEQAKRLTKLSMKDSNTGRFLLSGQDALLIKCSEIGKILNENLIKYKTFLKSGRLDNIAISGIYQTNHGVKKPVGYINLINYNTEVSIEEKLVQISSEIARFFEIEGNSRRIRNRQKDQKFINDLNKDDVSIRVLITKTLAYLAGEFNAGIVSFRVPVINGPDIDPEKNLIFVLRDVYVDPKIANSHEIDYYYRTTKKTLKLVDDITFKDKVIMGFPEDIYLDMNEQDDDFFKEINLHEVLQTRLNIILPVRKNNNDKEEPRTGKKDLYWNLLIGIINIQPYEEYDSYDYQERMIFLTHFFSTILSNIINKNKITQINILSEQISQLKIDKYETSMLQIASLIKTVINAETCSLFMYNKINSRVELKATTAKTIQYEQLRKKAEDVKPLEKIFFEMSDRSSVTVRSINDRQVFMLYDLNLYTDYSERFIEIIEDERGKEILVDQYVWLIIPIMDNSKKAVGAIKLFGLKNFDNELRHTFFEFDREMLNLISSLTFSLIEIANLDYEKDSYLKHIIHELKNPVTELLWKSEAMKGRMQRSGTLNKDYLNFFGSLSNNIMLQKSIFANIKDFMQPIILKKEPTDVHGILLFVVRLLEETALFEKQLIIRTNVSKLPSLNVDKYRVQQVFINLLQNAINYSNDGTVIEIFYSLTQDTINEKRGSYHEIQFQNTGIGILESEKNDIFERYYRGSQAIEMKTSGMGIGLNLAREIMRAHGGDCVVRQLNNPTIISVFFPSI